MNPFSKIHYFKQFLFVFLMMGCVLIFVSCGKNEDDIGLGTDNDIEIISDVPEEFNIPVVEDQGLENLDVTTPVEPGVVYITMMVHLEHKSDEATSQKSFQDHAALIRDFATIFNAHNAKATFEAKPEFVEGCKKWGDNVLLELYNQGHGIGVHADAGGQAEDRGVTQEQMTQQIAEMKTEMEAVLGHEVRHVSGICSSLDWVKAAIDAGYQFTSGMVGYCALSLPEAMRPDEYKFCSTPQECHGEIPLELKDRVHPWRASSSLDWLKDDPKGDLVLFAPENLLPAMGGGKGGLFDESDIEEYIRRLEEAITYSNQGKITTFYVGWSIGEEAIGDEMLGKWLDAIQPYVDSGQVKWKTLPEMYDAYVQ